MINRVLESVRSRYCKVQKAIASNDLLIALVVVVVVITIGAFFGWYNNKVIPVIPVPHLHYTLEGNATFRFLSNWDGPDYLNIVKYGYGGLFQANFFPLYPLVVRLVNLIVPSLLNSALIVSWISFVGAIYFYIKNVKYLFSVTNASEVVKSIMFFVLFPTGVFLFATYTESLFAMLALGAIYYAFKRRYLLSAILTLFSTATHITGIFVVILIGAILLEQREKIIKVVGYMTIGSLGLLSYMYFLYVKFRDPLAFVKSQEQIHGWLKYGWLNIFTSIDFFNVIFIFLLILSVIYWWKRRKSFALYSFLFLLIPIVGRQYGGFNRYVLMAFPMQFMLFDFFSSNKKSLYPYATALLAICWTYFVLQYSGGYVGG